MYGKHHRHRQTRQHPGKREFVTKRLQGCSKFHDDQLTAN